MRAQLIDAESAATSRTQTAQTFEAEAICAIQQNTKLWSEVEELTNKLRTSQVGAERGHNHAAAEIMAEMHMANNQIEYLKGQNAQISATAAELRKTVAEKDSELADWENQYKAQSFQPYLALDGSDPDLDEGADDAYRAGGRGPASTPVRNVRMQGSPRLLTEEAPNP